VTLARVASASSCNRQRPGSVCGPPSTFRLLPQRHIFPSNKVGPIASPRALLAIRPIANSTISQTSSAQETVEARASRNRVIELLTHYASLLYPMAVYTVYFAPSEVFDLKPTRYLVLRLYTSLRLSGFA
jgi:hypothetical protein